MRCSPSARRSAAAPSAWRRWRPDIARRDNARIQWRTRPALPPRFRHGCGRSSRLRHRRRECGIRPAAAPWAAGRWRPRSCASAGGREPQSLSCEARGADARCRLLADRLSSTYECWTARLFLVRVGGAVLREQSIAQAAASTMARKTMRKRIVGTHWIQCSAIPCVLATRNNSLTKSDSRL